MAIEKVRAHFAQFGIADRVSKLENVKDLTIFSIDTTYQS